MKKINIGHFVMTSIIILAGLTVQAQDKKEMMPNDQAWLQKFVGKWSGTFVSVDDKKNSTSVTSQLEFQPVADGRGIYGTEVLTHPTMGKMMFSYIMGYDPYEKKIHFYAVNNVDICHDHQVVWKSPDHMYVEHKSDRNGKVYMEKADLVFKDKDTIEMTEIDSLDGKVTETDKGTLKRVK